MVCLVQAPKLQMRTLAKKLNCFRIAVFPYVLKLFFKICHSYREKNIKGYQTFQKTKQYQDKQIIANLTPDQRFFPGFALAWMVNMRLEAIANQVRNDEHSPAKYRVIGTLSNMPEFYKAFGVKEGDKMWRHDSLIVSIW